MVVGPRVPWHGIRLFLLLRPRLKTMAVVALVLALTGPGMSGCSASHGVHAVMPDEVPELLRVGVTPTYPPLVFKEANRVRGVEADLAHAVSEGLGVRYLLVELPWSDLIPALKERRIDVIMAGMTDTRVVRV